LFGTSVLGGRGKKKTKGSRNWKTTYGKSEGFWRWCITICNTVFLDFVHRLNF
jgi:hypothetical protein